MKHDKNNGHIFNLKVDYGICDSRLLTLKNLLLRKCEVSIVDYKKIGDRLFDIPDEGLTILAPE